MRSRWRVKAHGDAQWREGERGDGGGVAGQVAVQSEGGVSEIRKIELVSLE